MKHVLSIGAGVLALALASSPAGASFVGVSGPNSSLGAAPEILSAAPSQLLDDLVTNEGQQGFDEKQGVVLTSAIDVDGGGVIAAGTMVNSHMIFFNQDHSGSGSFLSQSHMDVVWTFSGTILGTMSDTDGLLEAASNDQLGHGDTTYPGSFLFRGLEGGGDEFTVSGNQLTVDLDMVVIQPGDWMRVVTAVPEPTTALIVGLGLAMFGVGARRRKRARV